MMIAVRRHVHVPLDDTRGGRVIASAPVELNLE